MMIRASDVNETWFNPAFVVSFSWGEYRSLALQMVNGKEVIVPRGPQSAKIYKILTKKDEE